MKELAVGDETKETFGKHTRSCAPSLSNTLDVLDGTRNLMAAKLHTLC